MPEPTKPSNPADVASAAHAAGTDALVRLGIPRREAGGFAQAVIVAALPFFSAGWIAETQAAMTELAETIRVGSEKAMLAAVDAALAADRVQRPFRDQPEAPDA